jgi:hypothetical protein
MLPLCHRTVVVVVELMGYETRHDVAAAAVSLRRCQANTWEVM